MVVLRNVLAMSNTGSLGVLKVIGRVVTCFYDIDFNRTCVDGWF